MGRTFNQIRKSVLGSNFDVNSYSKSKAQKKDRTFDEIKNDVMSGKTDFSLVKAELERRINFDTFQSDFTNMGKTVGDLHNGWNSPETMSAARSSVESMQSRLSAYKDYQMLFGKKDNGRVIGVINDMQSGVRDTLGGVDELAKRYGNFKDANSYDAYVTEQNKLSELYSMSAYEIAPEIYKVNHNGASNVAYTTSDGQEITWKALYRQAQFREEFLSVSDKNSSNYDSNYDEYVEKGKSIPYTEVGTERRKRRGGAGKTRPMIVTVKSDTRLAAEALYAHVNGISREDFVNNTHFTDKDMVFSLMTEKEYNDLAYCIAKDKEDGGDRTTRYVEYITESLNQRRGLEMAKTIDNGFEKFFFAIEAGLDQFFGGIHSLTSDKDYIPVSPTQFASAEVRESIDSKLGRVGYDITTTTANMLPSILVSAANPVGGAALGAIAMGMSAKGNAYQEMLNLGYDKGQARTYSSLIGIAEGGLQYVLGGIGKLGGVSGKLSKAVAGIDNGIARFAIQWGGSMAAEGFEEAAQEVLNPLFKNLATGFDSSAEVDWSEVAYSGLLGALSGGFMEGGPLAINSISEHSLNKSLGKDIKANDRVSDVFDLASNPEVASAYDLYTKYAKKEITAENISDVQLGRLHTNASLDAQETIESAENVLKSKRATAEQKAEAQKQIDSAKKTLENLGVYSQADASTRTGSARNIDEKMFKDYDTESIVNLIESGLESAENTEAHRIANEYKSKIDNYDKIAEIVKKKMSLKEDETLTEEEIQILADSKTKLSTKEIAKLSEANDIAIKSEETNDVVSELVEMGESEEVAKLITRKMRGETLTSEESEKVAERVMENSEILSVMAENSDGELAEMVREMGREKGGLFLAAYDGKSDLEAYTNAFNIAVAKSENNFSFAELMKTKGVLSTEQIKKIYSDVRIKADHNQRAKFQKLSEETAKLKAYKGKIDDSVIDYENTSKKGKVNWKDLTDRQRKAVTFIKGFAQAAGINLDFVVNNPKYNGKYNRTTNTITINLDEGGIDTINNLIESIIPATSHELTHWMEKKSPTLYRRISALVFSTLEKYDGISENDRIASEIKKLTEKGKLKESQDESIKNEVARSEIIARACEDMLSRSKVGREIFNSLNDSDKKTLTDKIKDIIQAFKDWVKEALGLYKAESYEASVLRKFQKEADRISRLWDEMLTESVEVNQALEKSNVFGNTVDSIGTRDLSDLSGAKDLDGNELFQYKAMVEDEATYRHMLIKYMDTIGITKKQINDLFNTIDKAVDIISENLNELDYAWDTDINDRAFNPIKPNSDTLYKVSLDFSTLCRKRLLQQTIQQTLQNALNKNLSKEESIAIRDELIKVQEEGRKIEVACALCYVESARMKSPVQINKFLNNRDSVIKEFFANRSDGSIKEKIAKAELKARQELQKANPDGFYGKNKVKLDPLTAPKSHMIKADADYIRAEGKKAKASYKLTEHEQAELDAAMKMSVDDFTSAKGLENLAKKHPDLFDAYTSLVRNATHSKGIENDTWWRAGDSESIGDTLIAQMNEENGLRSQSWSDFQVIHLLDYIAATIELSTKGAKRQSYTKVPDYVKLLGNTGDMINMSLIPESTFNGKLAYDSVEGMAYDIAKQLRDEYHATVGTICIGINNEQISMLLEDATIDMVIPYHHSAMSKVVRKLMHIPAWETYQDYQNEKKLSDADALARANEYGVELKKDNNYQKAPKFSEWFNLDEARQIAKMENGHPSNMEAYKKYGKMYGGYMAMQNAANNYLKLCAERGLAPKFSHEKADFTHDANYWKLLIDRKMVDNVTGEIIEQKAIKPIFKEQSVLEILNDELARYPQVKADQEYATRKVTEKFLSGEMNVDKSTLEAIKKPIDNITNVNILESSKDDNELHSEKTDSLSEEDYKSNCKELVQMDFVSELNGTELDGKLPLKQKVSDLFDSWGNAINTERFGSVALTNSSIRSEFRHGTTKNKVTAYAAIPSVLRDGTVIDVQKKNHGEVERIIVAAPIKIANVPFFMGVMIQKDSNTNRLYLHDVVIKKEASDYQTEHLNTTGPVETENLFMTEVLEKAISVGYSLTHQSEKVNELLSDKQQSVYDIMGETERVKKENESLNADVNNLSKIISTEDILNDTLGTKGIPNRKFLTLANYLKKLSGSNVDSAILGNQLKEAYNSLLHSDSLTWNDIARKTYSIAEYIISNNKVALPGYIKNATNETGNTITDYFKDVMQEIRKDTISLTKEQINSVEKRFGNYNTFHKYVFGRVNIVKYTGMSLEEAWKSWSKKYPTIFDANLESDKQLSALIEAVDILKTSNTILNEYEHSEATRYLSTEIYNQFWNIAVDSASAYMAEEAESYRTEHKALMNNLRKDYEKRQNDLAVHPVGETAIKYEGLLKKVKEQKKKDVAKAKEHGKEMLTKYKDNAEKKTRIQRITANALTLNKWLTTNSKDYHIHEAMKGPVTKLLQALDFSSKSMLTDGSPTQKDVSLAEAFSDVKSMLINADNMVEGLEALYGHDLADGIDLLSKAAFNLVGDNNYIINAMSNEELYHLDRLVRHIKKVVTDLNKFHVLNHQKGAVSLANEFIEHGEKLGNIKKQHGKIGKFLEFRNRTPYYFFKDLGEVGQKLFTAFQDGWDKLAFNAKKIIDFTEETYTAKEVKEWSKETKTIKLTQFDGTERTFEMSTAQIMALHCVSKQQDAQNHLLDGGMTLKRIDKKGHVVADYENINLTYDDVQMILSNLTDRQIEVADKLQKFMNTVCSGWGNEISMARFGIEMFGLPNYFPIKVSEATVPTDNTKDVDNASLFRLLNMSFTKARNQNANQSIEIGDIFDIFAQHSSDMAKYNALALPVLDFNKFYSIHGMDETGKEYGVVKTLKSVFGDEANGYIRRFVKDLNGSQNVSRDVIGNTFFKNAKVASVAANLRVVLLQPTAFFKASAVLDSKYLMKASAYMKYEPIGMYKRFKNAIEKAEKYCGMAQWKSLGYYDTDISKGLTEKIKHAESVKDKVVEKSMKGAEIADKVTFGTLWVACEFDIKDNRKDLKVGSKEYYDAVANRLREVIYATQVVDSTMTRSDMMRSPDTGNKMLTTFGSEPIVAYNMLLDLATQYHRDKQEFGKKVARKRSGKKIRKVVIAYTITNAMAALVESCFDAFRDDDDEDLEKFMKRYFENFAFDMSIGNKLPLVKEAYSYFQGYSSSRMDTQWMEQIFKTLETIEKLYSGKGDLKKTIKTFTKAMSDLLGIPFYNVFRDAMALLDNLDIFDEEEEE